MNRVAAEKVSDTFKSVPVDELADHLGLPISLTPSLTPLADWSMQRDDAPILHAIFAASRPERHLEFGTWQGFGSRLVMQACDASVWSINLPNGETSDAGDWLYAEDYDSPDAAPRGAGPAKDFREGGGRVYYQSDAHGFIGRLVHEAGLGHRFCQILCDSQQWDTSNYPAGFFDSVFIDGGHTSAIVTSDTRKALPLVRPGGLVLWHDFCPASEVLAISEAARGVADAITRMQPELSELLDELFWIEPSHLLVGIRNTNATSRGAS